ncbi:flavin-dependent monooxygenase [Myxococcota bacterium]|nr:flavin-dependent monooxygenase [Myxococcota bacterium]
MVEDEFLKRLDELLPAIGERAEETEALRRIPDATIQELRDSGLMKALQPARWGGSELDPLTLYRAARAIGRRCGSTAWVYGILGVHPWHVALFPEQAQAEVWGDDDSTLIASTYAPVGQVTRVEGGYRLSGHWPWSSGTDHCPWVLLGAVDLTEPEQPDMLTFLLPRSDYEIIDTWHAEGLRGTGTNDVVVEDAFVPSYRTLSFADTSVCDCPGNAVNPAALYRLPFASVFSTTIYAAALGIAEGGLEAYQQILSARFKIAYGQAAREEPHAQVSLARSHSMVDAAWLQLERNIGSLTDAVKAGRGLGVLERTRLRHDQAYGVSRAIEAIDQCFESSGGEVLRRGNTLQRFWRDLHAARQHAINDYERAAELYGKALLGIEVADAMF